MIWGEKKGHKNHPKKRARAQPFVLARWRQKKKSGLSRRKLVMLGWQMPSYPLPTHLPTKHYGISAPVRVFSHRVVYF
jgi:hypothetical protein